MRYSLLIGVFAACAVIGCSESTDLGPTDVEYIRTTVDLVRTRSLLPAGTDSLAVKRAVDAVFVRHHTNASEYKSDAAKLGSDPQKAQKIIEAVRDSLKSLK